MARRRATTTTANENVKTSVYDFEDEVSKLQIIVLSSMGELSPVALHRKCKKYIISLLSISHHTIIRNDDYS